MGIADLLDVIRNECTQNQLVTYTFDELFGFRLAIDISIFLYKYIRAAGPERWKSPFILLLCNLKKQGVKAVCIFDGPNPPVEKQLEQQRRRGERERSVDRMKQCQVMKKKLETHYLPGDVSVEGRVKDECKMLISPSKGRLDATDYNSPSDVIDALDRTIERLDKQTQPITEKHVKTAMKIVKMLGLACFQSHGEAETLCAYLAITGKVDAVLTEDTDVLAYGTPFMLGFKNYRLGDGKLVGIYLPSVLKDLQLDQDEFRDLCILLSCDYNSRVKGYPPDGRKYKKPINIGAKKAYVMIQKYRRLEEVSKYLEDDTPLKFRRCRELFTIPKKVSCDMVPLNKPLRKERLVNFIDKHRITIDIDFIESCWQSPEIDIIDDSNFVSSKSYYVLLSLQCEDDEGNEILYKVPAKFRNYDHFEGIADEEYHDILHLANKWSGIDSGYHVEAIECIQMDIPKTKKKLLDLTAL